jgi:predicted DCC family thiol-disulfide oxidoreductase YuxK
MALVVASKTTMGSVVLFDGTCNLCNRTVQFIIDHERSADLRFAALQSEKGGALLEEAMGKDAAHALVQGATGSGDPDSIVIVEDGKAFTHSTAGLRIARRLRAPWSWGFAFIVVPAFLRDIVYRFIARNRYRWFGKTDTCRVPTPELKARFLT